MTINCEYKKVCKDFEHESLKCCFGYGLCKQRATYKHLEKVKLNEDMERAINFGDVGLARHFTDVSCS